MATARRLALCVLLTCASASTAAPAYAHAPQWVAAVAPGGEVQTDGADGAADNTTASTIVASEGPVPEGNPEAGARAPGIGPILVPASGSSFTGAWWLVAFGGLQLVGLFFITRRARARLSAGDAQP